MCWSTELCYIVMQLFRWLLFCFTRHTMSLSQRWLRDISAERDKSNPVWSSNYGSVAQISFTHHLSLFCPALYFLFGTYSILHRFLSEIVYSFTPGFKVHISFCWSLRLSCYSLLSNSPLCRVCVSSGCEPIQIPMVRSWHSRCPVQMNLRRPVEYVIGLCIFNS